MSASDERTVCIVLHDAAPSTRAACVRTLAAVRDVAGDAPVTILAVPRYHDEKPTDQFEGYIEGSGGDYGMWRAQGVVNVPLSDTFKVRIAADRQKRDGYMHNLSGIGPDRYNDTNYFAGLIVMTLGPVSGQSSISGNLLAVTAAVFYSGCMLIPGRLCRSYPTIAVTAWSFVGAALGSLPAAWFEDRFMPVGLYGWAYLGLYGVLTLVGYLLINRSLGKLPTALVAVLGYGQPVVATILGFFILHETPTLDGILGSIIIVIGLVLATRQPKDGADGEKPPQKPLAPAS